MILITSEQNRQKLTDMVALLYLFAQLLYLHLSGEFSPIIEDNLGQ